METDAHEHQDETAAGSAGNGEAAEAPEGGLQEQVLESLKNVIDPELGINIVDLGLVYHVGVDDDTVRVEYTLTTMGCPIGPLVEAQMEQLVAKIDGVESFEAELVFSPPWTPEQMSEEAKAALGMV